MQHPCHPSKEEGEQSYSKIQMHKGLGPGHLSSLVSVFLGLRERVGFRALVSN
jgi:hypothetical protein